MHTYSNINYSCLLTIPYSQGEANWEISGPVFFNNGGLKLSLVFYHFTMGLFKHDTHVFVEKNWKKCEAVSVKNLKNH